MNRVWYQNLHEHPILPQPGEQCLSFLYRKSSLITEIKNDSLRSKLLTNYSYLLPKQREFISGKDPESFLGLLLAKRLLFLTSFQRLHYIPSILAGFSSSPASYLEAYFLGIKSSLNFIFLFVVQKSSYSIQPMSLIKRSISYIIIKISVFDF